MVLLQAHYRSQITITGDTIDAAVNALAGLDSFAARTSGVAAVAPDADVLDAFRAAMDDDLDTPKATALLFDTVRRANAALDAGDDSAPALVAAAHEIATAFGLVLRSSGEVPPDVADRLARRRISGRPTPSVPSSKPTAGPSRPRSPAPLSGGEWSLGTSFGLVGWELC
jgi:cysteinyl-tRNA synthetase